MSVRWGARSLDDRKDQLDRAWELALQARDPALWTAAEIRDDRIQAEGDALDGAATYARGPLAGSHVYPLADGTRVLLYRRDGDEVLIERVLPSRSDWREADGTG